MKVVLTGAGGFLGWHTRLRLHALTNHEVVPVGRTEWQGLTSIVGGADAIIHIAGVNRADSDNEVREGNLSLAAELAEAITRAGRPLRVVFANSTQAGNGTPYGTGKEDSARILREATEANGGWFVDVLLPNIFGEHGRPRYNSFVATFVHATVTGENVTINDNQVGLLHVQDAAQALLDGLTEDVAQLRPAPETHGVQEVWDLLQEFHATYVPQGEIPDLSSKFRIDLFNTYRSALFPEHYPIQLVPHSDPRGAFVETVRCRGGEGQTSFSTTVPGITRGEHYHLSKIERFAIIRGKGTMELRKMFTDEVLTFEADGESPVAIDMPVGWVHNITNTGDEVLFTQFWSHELFRSEAPDTFPEPVRPQE
ncbi:nucleoside-diphosphate-sugar epimerase [Janibacter hoylei PVAS-1]|uniref:Capsule biosynthesis protein CapF n=1 Tax=Janibacter hoylei PVAS-1 TaxID=1210046 RepID=K1E2Y5_9MICO|nr:NAD-dependent epimerase/dehydratase family protein [Janibacter hoylei]EKA61351.1 nucleoside-diphosphate-sugar epimerase [Janibacter hoylei PVAS-1]RWU84459.1 capsule biosynthesis protein CapF [Janibacter hoylei PVAS-1]